MTSTYHRDNRGRDETSMTDPEYREYLKSDKWKMIAAQRLKIDNMTCQCCGSKGTQLNPLQVHHLSYRHIGNEENFIFEDLVTLCRPCHMGLHRILNRVTSPNGRRGWKDARQVPQVHVFTMSGEANAHIERKGE